MRSRPRLAALCGIACGAACGGGSAASIDAAPGPDAVVLPPDAELAPDAMIDPCDACDPLATCDPLGAPVCACPAGFDGDGVAASTACVDVDECAAEHAPCGSFACVNAPGAFACEAWLAIQPWEPRVARYAPGDGRQLDSFPISMPGFALQGLLGRAVEPGTGAVYVIAKLEDDSRRLAVLDLAAATIADVGLLADRVATIVFGDDGTLYAATGNGAAAPETLHTLELATAAMTEVGPLPTKTDGECLAWDAGTQRLVRFTRAGTDAEMSTFAPDAPGDPTVVATIPLLGEPWSCAALADGSFLVTTYGGEAMLVDAAGQATPLTEIDDARSLWPVTSPAPHAVTPNVGGVGGVTAITLTGLGLGETFAIQIDGLAPDAFTVTGDDAIELVVPPAMAPGPVDIIARTPWGIARWPAGFTYVPAPL